MSEDPLELTYRARQDDLSTVTPRLVFRLLRWSLYTMLFLALEITVLFLTILAWDRGTTGRRIIWAGLTVLFLVLSVWGCSVIYLIWRNRQSPPANQMRLD
jgi:hypothetical protein